jgi:predicted nucleotidyltransferase
MPWADSFVHKLELHLGAQFPTMKACYELSEVKLSELSYLVGRSLPSQSSFVAFGSLARKEYTDGSDLDWRLLIDGKADTGHRDYDRFLGILTATEKRAELKMLTFEESESNPLFREVRTLGHEFQDSLNHLFLTPDTMRSTEACCSHTKYYGGFATELLTFTRAKYRMTVSIDRSVHHRMPRSPRWLG